MPLMPASSTSIFTSSANCVVLSQAFALRRREIRGCEGGKRREENELVEYGTGDDGVSGSYLCVCRKDASIDGRVGQRIEAANVTLLFEIGSEELVEHLVLQLFAAHQIALENEAMSICGLADDSLEVAGKGEGIEGIESMSRACPRGDRIKWSGLFIDGGA